MKDLINVLTNLFAMEAELGEETGVVALFSELQNEMFSETQANTFKNDPSRLDADRLVDVLKTVEAMREKMVQQKKLCEERAEKLGALDQKISNLTLELGENKSYYRNAALLQHPPLSLRKIEAYEAIEKELISLRHRREVQIHELANRLRVYWEQLQTPTEHRAEFIRRNEGRSLEVIKACEEEISSLEAQKQTRVKELVMNFIADIRNYWDFLSVSDMERRLFEDKYDYTQATFSDETLETHKVLAATLRSQVSRAEPVFERIKEHQFLLTENARYEELTKNSDRLRDRKYKLADEEKLRKLVQPLPRLTDALIADLCDWKTQNKNQPLLYKGIDYLSFLLAEKEKAAAIKAEKEEKRRGTSSMSLKLAAPTPSKQPQASSSTITPPPQASMTPMRPKAQSVTAKTTIAVAPSTTGKPITAKARTVSSEAVNKIGIPAKNTSNENKDPSKGSKVY